MSKKIQILVRNGLVEIPVSKTKKAPKTNIEALGTVVSNLAYYGFALNSEALSAVSKLSDNHNQLCLWWEKVEPVLKAVTGASKNMGEFVVYKNFPAEVLEKSTAEYWIAQIFMYLGCPNDLFTQPVQKRDRLFEKTNLKVLQLANENSLKSIFSSLVGMPSLWQAEQLKDVFWIYQNEKINWNKVSIPFKGNLIAFLSKFIEEGIVPELSSATDVLRLGIGLSGGDISMKTNTPFRNFKRKERKFLLQLLENSSNLSEDVARDKERWKKFLRNLHPGDYKFKKVSGVYNLLYKDRARSWNSSLEYFLNDRDSSMVLSMLVERPGEFMRRLNQTISIFKGEAVDAFITVLPKLKTIQLLKIQKYLNTVNDKKFRTIAPGGNWSKLKILDNNTKIKQEYIEKLNKAINSVLKRKLGIKLKNGVVLDKTADMIKFQTNDSENLYGRGTEFFIPENAKFIRTASYWECQAGYNTWFDNGWNFFDSNWKSKGACCWSYASTNFLGGAAIFSGDPTNSKTVDGKACQMIDLYIDKLKNAGVRYCVWNILCFSRIKFSQAKDVFAALQWGTEPQKGELFEPARCQLAFPLKGDAFTKYVAVIDLHTRKLIYIDANLKSDTNSAANNCDILEKNMPAFMEYLKTLPSAKELFQNAAKKKNGVVIAYSDKNYKIKKGKALILKPENKENKFEQLNVSEILNS